jgi:NADH dehydrogenase FAD-containing subunit
MPKPPPMTNNPRCPQVTAAERIASYQAAYQRVAKAASVVVVGGGTVGVELAAEVVGKFGKTKAVTLIGSSPR